MAVLTNARHERFVQALISGKSALDAYAEAGYTSNRHHAWRLAQKASVRERLAELQGKAAQKAGLTLDALISEAEDARQKAMSEQGGASAAVAAIKEKGILSGLRIERRETDNVNTNNYTISDEPLSDDDWSTKYVTPH